MEQAIHDAEAATEACRRAMEDPAIASDPVALQERLAAFEAEIAAFCGTRHAIACASGTERMAFVARRFPASYYVNVQGDEPLIHADTIKETVRLALKKKGIATAATPLKESERADPSAVKVVMDIHGRALYFSRAMIPSEAHGVSSSGPGYKHLGLYVYPKKDLLKFVRWEPAELERTEKLEQLRVLYQGVPIYVAVTPHDSIGVDTPEDLKKVEQILRDLEK